MTSCAGSTTTEMKGMNKFERGIAKAAEVLRSSMDVQSRERELAQAGGGAGRRRDRVEARRCVEAEGGGGVRLSEAAIL